MIILYVNLVYDQSKKEQLNYRIKAVADLGGGGGGGGGEGDRVVTT